MGTNKDLRRKLDGQIAAYNEHNRKCLAYSHEQDKAFARKTMHNVQNQIKKLCDRMGEPVPIPCETCGNIHARPFLSCRPMP